MEQQSGRPPVPLHSPIGHAAERGEFRKREAAKEVEVDELREARIERRQLIERVAKMHELCRGLHSMRSQLVITCESDFEVPAAFERLTPAGVVDDEPPHRARRIRKESRAVHKGEPVVARHVDIRLVQEGRRAEREGTPCAPQNGAPPANAVPRNNTRIGCQRPRDPTRSPAGRARPDRRWVTACHRQPASWTLQFDVRGTRSPNSAVAVTTPPSWTRRSRARRAARAQQ